MMAEPQMGRQQVCATGDVILIEDDMSVRTALERILRSAGYRVVALDCGDALLDGTRPLRANDLCIVCDIRLPRVSGFELHNRLTAQGATPPWIFITGHDDAAVRKQAERLGSGYLPKPFEARELLALIAALATALVPGKAQTPNG